MPWLEDGESSKGVMRARNLAGKSSVGSASLVFSRMKMAECNASFV